MSRQATEWVTTMTVRPASASSRSIVINVNPERMRAYAESSPSVVTPLNRVIGYEEAAKVVKRAMAEGATIRDTVVAMGYVERGEITEDQLDEALDVSAMTRP